jgi:anthranilate phosphoribosyltransferase
MGISHFIKEIGRGKEGARSLSRAQAADLLGQVLDGTTTDLEVGAFCIAMRVKGETADEMAGFLDAVHARLKPLACVASGPVVVLPSYNGSRRLPLLTPLLALLLAREGLAVLVHGSASENRRLSMADWVAASRLSGLQTFEAATPLNTAQPAIKDIATIRDGQACWLPTARLCPALEQLLQVRRTIGLRNPAHSLVKLMNPLAATGHAALVVGSYTHPEYAQSMADTVTLVQGHALLLRGTEGEPVADARRQPGLRGYVAGQCVLEVPAQEGPLAALPEWPTQVTADSVRAYTQAVLDGALPVPTPLAAQVAALVKLHALARRQQADAPGSTPRAAAV